MCGPFVSWDWLVLDVSYVLALLGGTLVLRARCAPPLTWVAFGVLSALVGGTLFAGTWGAQAAAAEAARATDVVEMLASSC